MAASGAAKDAATAATYKELGATSQAADPATRFIFTSLPEGSPARIILRFYPAAACSGGSGLTPADAETVPSQLAARGVSADEWRAFTSRLAAEVQPHSTGGLWQCMMWTLLLPSPILCWRMRSYNRALGAWVAELNARVLNPRGCHAKFGACQANGNKYHEEQSWLAIALHPEEGEVLRGEPVFWRPACCSTSELVADECQCRACCGVERVVV